MSNKRAIKEVNRTIQEIKGNQNIMSKMVVLSAGELREIFPIIRRDTLADEISKHLYFRSQKRVHITTFGFSTVSMECYSTGHKFVLDDYDATYKLAIRILRGLCLKLTDEKESKAFRAPVLGRLYITAVHKFVLDDYDATYKLAIKILRGLCLKLTDEKESKAFR
ncbi:unnamed protein product [Danaus chrysippus]|uniref:(African queen) hypothetical protein n=1 Tax=Danaus chrysippus TaxID=151541 RepID=A0A8J2QT46_9NEOP|nr:unnamed protein product [Danaus chrysippus]